MHKGENLRQNALKGALSEGVEKRNFKFIFTKGKLSMEHIFSMSISILTKIINHFLIYYDRWFITIIENYHKSIEYTFYVSFYFNRHNK